MHRTREPRPLAARSGRPLFQLSEAAEERGSEGGETRLASYLFAKNTSLSV